MSQSSSGYDTAAIRQLILDALSDSELTQICFDYFPSVYKEFSTQSRTEKIQLLLEYCVHHNEFPVLLAQIRERNPSKYFQFTRDGARNVVGLSEGRIPQVDLSSTALESDYRQSLGRPFPERDRAAENIQFRNREDICHAILQSKANHIELYGPAGIGKTYLLKHLASAPEHNHIRAVYVDLALRLRAGDILPLVTGELKGELPQSAVSPIDLAIAIKNLYRAHDRPISHFMFLFDSATEEHREVIDWLISREGLINNPQFIDSLKIQGIEDVKLQVVIAERRPIIRPRNFHRDLHLDTIGIGRLKPTLDPAQDPVQNILRELADQRGVDLRPQYCQSFSDEIYYHTGGHPKCSALMALDVAATGFIPQREQWREFFETHVPPTIQSEMLGAIADYDLLSVFWTLSVFRRFDQPLLINLIDHGLLPIPKPYTNLGTAQQARRIRASLVETYLVNEPDGDESMCTMNLAVRRALSLNMQYRFTDRFRALNSAALEIFTHWFQDSQTPPERLVVGLIEIVYHSFKALETDPDIQTSEICTRISIALEYYLEMLLNSIPEERWPDYLSRLRAYWETDLELRETAKRATDGRDCYDTLSQRIREFVSGH